MRIEKRSATRWFKCVACGEQIRDCEKYLQVVDANDKQVRGERYCLSCEDIAKRNNVMDVDDDDDCERGLRAREAYASYQAAGCTHEYWSDRDNGYAH